VDVRSLAAAVTVLSKSGVSLAFVLFLLAAIVAAILAVGSTIFSVSVTARRRIVELASLRAVGIETKTLRRSLALEQFLVLGTGVVAGAAAGLIATAGALPSIPEDFAVGPAPPLDFGLPLAAMGLILLAAIVSLGVTVVLATRLVVGRASVDKLGGEQ
jgi:ABC-type antimicrobial peptide transport system permease subunit